MAGKTPFDLQAYLRKKGAVVERALMSCFPEPEGPESVVIEAMKYSLFAGGKRLRPILCIAGAETVGGTEKDVLPVACALEMIHTYSLIHDDLPPMDDDDLRRGRPSNHKVFGEAVALLAGDGLLTEAFHLMAGDAWAERASSPVILKVIGLVSRAAGCAGMVGGQVVDVTWEGKAADLSIVEYIHTHKTGALIKAAGENGARVRILVTPDPFEGVESLIALQILQGELAKMGIEHLVEVRFFEGDMHPKANLIDDQFLIIGSQKFRDEELKLRRSNRGFYP